MQNKLFYIKKFFFPFILVFIPFLFFFSPKFEESQCFKPIKFNSTILYMHNCDNNSITSSSTNYLNFIFGWENNPWRGRPLHVLIGTLGAPIFSPVALISNYYLKDKIHS